VAGLLAAVRRPSGSSVRLINGDARALAGVPDRSVHLVLTSPPYPMIPQWDGLFRALGATDYPGMLRVLSGVWTECRRVLVPGGILAINVGDALRTVGGEFRLWPNHAETMLAVSRLGLTPLPYLLWKKPTNRPNAFLGSGFLPPNAYVTLDCEYILLFRNGALRAFPRHDPERLASRFSKSERDLWFSQVWSDIRGARQGTRSGRSGAFPDQLAERLVRMFSVRGDTVLDPFAGTGTTLWAAARWGRNAVGVEWDRGTYTTLQASARARGLLNPSRREPRRLRPARARSKPSAPRGGPSPRRRRS
jgi:DNA modification methylase